MKKAIVTGANGFVGKAVVKELIQQEIDVYAIVRPGAHHLDNLENAHIIECDLSDYAQLKDMSCLTGSDYFFHFAWAGTSGSLRGDEYVQLNNIKATCDAVHIAKALNIGRFIYASSIMEYEYMKLIETRVDLSRSSIYAVSKLTADNMARTIAKDIGLEYISGLISNIYGPGEYSPRLINSYIRKLLQGENTSFTPGEQLYDFIYIDDAADMFVNIAEKGQDGTVYYIGNRDQRPLKDFLYEIRDVLVPGRRIGIGELPFSGVSLTYKEFDTSAVYNDTGIEPKISFSEGIKKTAEWINSQQGGNLSDG